MLASTALRDFAGGKDDALQRVEMRGDDAQRTDEIGEMRVADRAAQAGRWCGACAEAAPRRQHRIEELQQAPAAFDLARDLFQHRAIEPVGPDRPDVGAHARAGDAVDLDAVFLEHLDDADVRQPFRAAGGKREPDAAARDFAREAVDVQIEAVVRRRTAAMRSGKPRAIECTGWPSRRSVDVKLGRRDGFLGAEDRLHMIADAAGAVAEFAHEELEIVEILRARLEEDVGEVGLDDALDRRGHWRLRTGDGGGRTE